MIDERNKLEKLNTVKVYNLTRNVPSSQSNKFKEEQGYSSPAFPVPNAKQVKERSRDTVVLRSLSKNTTSSRKEQGYSSPAFPEPITVSRDKQGNTHREVEWGS